MVMVPFGAEPVAHLARPMRQRIDHAAFAEQRDGSVDGRQADPLALSSEAGVDLLGGRVGRLRSKHLEYP